MFARKLDQVMENYPDEDVSKSLAWFRSFMSSDEWDDRRSKIENYIEYALLSGYGLTDNKEEIFLKLNFEKDKIGWYLYLMDTCLYDANCYEPVAGARIFNIFKRIGEDLDQVKSIDGVTKKVRRLIKKDPTEADAVLFEILTALLWARNGYKVGLVPELSTKQPDIKAEKDGREWFIECKRLSKASDYGERERAKWLKMYTYLPQLLHRFDLVLEVTFHVELFELKDSFLFDILRDKLNKKPKNGLLVNNSKVTIRVSFANFATINAHLEKFSVRNPSPQMSELIGGKRDDTFGFTSGAVVQNFRLGSGIGNNIFAEQISKAWGAYWKSASSSAIDAKARDISRQIRAAIKQLPSDQATVIHIGIETYDGPEVEIRRFDKINKTMNDLGIEGENLSWVYCHFFQSYSPPDQHHVFDESLYRFKNMDIDLSEPLEETSLIIPWENNEENNLHWMKEQP